MLREASYDVDAYELNTAMAAALADPAGKGVEAVRPIRDEIKRRIEELIAELVPAKQSSAS